MRLQGLPGQTQQLAIARQRQVTGGNLADQADADAELRLPGGQILLQGLILEVTYPAKQIKLVGGHPQGNRKLMRFTRTPGVGEIFRYSSKGAKPVRIHLRQQFRPLNLVLCLGALDIECSHP